MLKEQQIKSVSSKKPKRSNSPKELQSWSVYLLYNSRTRRTYIGSTTDVNRRLRQHNREIVGGARSTRKGAPNWKLRMYISGFQNRSVACRWEKIIKMRARGIDARTAAMRMLVNGFCVSVTKYTKQYEVPEGLELICLPL